MCTFRPSSTTRLINLTGTTNRFVRPRLRRHTRAIVFEIEITETRVSTNNSRPKSNFRNRVIRSFPVIVFAATPFIRPRSFRYAGNATKRFSCRRRPFVCRTRNRVAIPLSKGSSFVYRFYRGKSVWLVGSEGAVASFAACLASVLYTLGTDRILSLHESRQPAKLS